jgi:diacylglycerol O-acyltransferase
MWFVSKATLVFSNVPGPKVPLTFNGVKSRGLIALIPGNGDLAFGISAISHCDSLIMAVSSDICYLEDPAEVRALIERNYDEIKAKLSITQN